jgi:hypothetical protein
LIKRIFIANSPGRQAAEIEKAENDCSSSAFIIGDQRLKSTLMCLPSRPLDDDFILFLAHRRLEVK